MELKDSMDVVVSDEGRGEKELEGGRLASHSG